MARAEPLAKRGCWWCGNPGATFPTAFVDRDRKPIAAPSVVPVGVVTCGWKCSEAVLDWADRRVNAIEREALKEGL